MGSSLRCAGSFRCGVGSLLWHAGFSLVVAGFSLVVVWGFSLSSGGAWAPGHVGSVVCCMRALLLRHASTVVVARGLSCPATCGISIPPPGIEPVSLALEGGFFTAGSPGKAL